LLENDCALALKRKLIEETGKMREIKFNKRSSIACLLTLSAFLASFIYFGFYSNGVDASGVADSVIVQLKDEPAAVWKARQQKAGNTVTDEQLQAYRNSITAKQNDFLNALQSRGVSYEIDGVDIKDFNGETQMRADYRFNLVLNAVTLKVPASALNIIKSMPQVKSVKPNENLSLNLNKSVPYINAPPVYGQYPELTPFDNFREGFEGQGINVAVLDTGIEWQHPMFGGDPTPPRFGLAPPIAAANTNQKVIYYLSTSAGFVDDFGHGSAAASNIAGYLAMAPGSDGLPGTGDDIRVHGVAPQARLMGYKVCTGTGSCVGTSTILGIEDAVSPVTLTLQPKPIAHVINLSLGGVGGPDSATALAADNAALLGTTVVASAGNSGPGEGTVGAPAAGRHVIAVGATTDPASANANWSVDVLKASAIPQATIGAVTPAKNLPAQDGFSRLKLFPMVGTPDPAAGSIAQRYVLVNSAATVAGFPANVRGRIALVKNTVLTAGTFAQVSNNAALAGAVGVILVSTTTNPTAVKGTIPSAIVSPADGEILVDAMLSNDNNSVDPAAGTISELPIRMNPFLTDVFVGETAGFSSRGPVLGYGQVKPDVTAPGVGITSATVRVGGATAGGGTMFDPTGYVKATGTSFSGPHVAGSAALVKQAHLDWSPDMIRTALINTATNLRTGNGTPKADGSTADSINDQGGGLIDVTAAVNTKALMGVEGDGITAPGILGSHSFGEKPILNNRVNNTFDVTVTIRDVSGQGGTFNLSTVNNRSTNIDGISTSVSQSSISVPAGGSATFTASVSIDGNIVRSTDIKQLQWYVVAQASNGKKLRTPMYLRATPSLPSDQISSSVTDVYTGTVLASDAGAQRDNDIYLANGATYEDVEFNVDASTLKLDGTLTWSITDTGAGVGLPDLDFLLVDPNGNIIGQSGNSDAPEHISANTTIPGTYIWRVYGWANGPTDFEVQSTQLKGGSAPVVQPFASDFTQGNVRHDFDGNYTINWTPNGAVEGYEVELSTDGINWTVASAVSGSTTSVSYSDVADGTYSYRVRSITAGRIGKFVTMPSNVESIKVSRRVEVDATDSINPINRSITFPAGATELVTALKNQSATITFYPNTRFEIVSISSAGNSVRAANADNGGDGVGSVAVYDYSQLVGSSFAPAAESGNKTIRFSNPNTVLFTFTARVKANVLAGSAGTSSGTKTSESSATGGTTSDGTTTDGTTTSGTTASALPTSSLFKFTVNPVTGTVSVSPLQ
jgi:subtilisin family serine protease